MTEWSIRMLLYCRPTLRCDRRLRLFAGNKNGNRRTANIRSVGYSDLFVLSKEALWNALREYPEAKKRLLEKGRQLLMKDGLLEDWAMTGEVTQKMKTEARIKKIEAMLNEAQTRLGRLMAGIASFQQHLAQRLERLEELLRYRNSLLDGGGEPTGNSH